MIWPSEEEIQGDMKLIDRVTGWVTGMVGRIDMWTRGLANEEEEGS